jgi:hypothetical protein
MVKCGVLFEVRAEFLNIIYTSFSLKGLNVCLLTFVGTTTLQSTVSHAVAMLRQQETNEVEHIFLFYAHPADDPRVKCLVIS